MEKRLTVDCKAFAKRANVIYDKLRPEVEATAKGQIMAIEIDSGDYFIGATEIEATRKARRKHPDKIFYFRRIGYPAVHIKR